MQYYLNLFIYYISCIGFVFNIYTLLILLKLKMHFLKKLLSRLNSDYILRIETNCYTTKFINDTIFNNFQTANLIILDLMNKHDTFDEYAIPIIKQIIGFKQ